MHNSFKLIMNKPRGSKVSEKQKELMVEYLKNRPLLLSGKFSNNFTHKDAVGEWQKLAEILNSVPRSTKDWKGWKKVRKTFL